MSTVPPKKIALAVTAVAGLVVITVVRPFPPAGQIVCYALLLGMLLVAVAMPGLEDLSVAAAEVKRERDKEQGRAKQFTTPRSKPEPQRGPPLNLRWTSACRHHDGVLGAYGAYELDPAMLLQYPALWDLSAQPVMDFHDALDMAGGLRTDAFPVDPSDAEDYIASVDMLRSAWTKADRFARSTGTDQLGEEDARDCRRALKLLRHADGASGQERASYLGQVITTVDRLADRGIVAPVDRISAELATRVQMAIEA
ncbi:hypothetical protein JVX90_07740 [Gordonia sp. PDNC005]|uniref:hypothetical protein n=1 Tax=unclassified Gordonia (in: high G+C Gram-positive bacteria) TaxID=2657482 RepID=UPI001965AEFD|nr:hypothetical protein [Gordonia sp. PDNC005]QRY64063.1 hypothetical protein JVX90_07740 [Gordonia sp. PDNC005]